MKKHDDRIARPARGRFFPVTVAETVRLIRDLGVVPAHRERLHIRFQNPGKDGPHGSEVAAFYPEDRVHIYSFPDHVDRLHAKATLEVALGAFAARGNVARPTVGQEVVSLRAYLTPKATLTVTQRTRRAQPVSYMRDKSFKPTRVKTEERVVDALDASHELSARGRGPAP
jgi:hypothetical protein